MTLKPEQWVLLNRREWDLWAILDDSTVFIKFSFFKKKKDLRHIWQNVKT